MDGAEIMFELIATAFGFNAKLCSQCASLRVDVSPPLGALGNRGMMRREHEPLSQPLNLRQDLRWCTSFRKARDPRSPVPRDSFVKSGCSGSGAANRRSFPSGPFLFYQPRLFEDSGFVSFTIKLRARFTYERHTTRYFQLFLPVTRCRTRHNIPFARNWML